MRKPKVTAKTSISPKKPLGPVGMQPEGTPHLDRLRSIRNSEERRFPGKPVDKTAAGRRAKAIEDTVDGKWDRYPDELSDVQVKNIMDGQERLNRNPAVLKDQMAKMMLDENGMAGKPGILKDRYTDYQAKNGEFAKPRARGKKA